MTSGSIVRHDIYSANARNFLYVLVIILRGTNVARAHDLLEKSSVVELWWQQRFMVRSAPSITGCKAPYGSEHAREGDI